MRQEDLCRRMLAHLLPNSSSASIAIKMAEVEISSYSTLVQNYSYLGVTARVSNATYRLRFLSLRCDWQCLCVS